MIVATLYQLAKIVKKLGGTLVGFDRFTQFLRHLTIPYYPTRSSNRVVAELQ